MTRTKLDTPAFADQSVDTRNIADGTVQAQDIAPGGVSAAKLPDTSCAMIVPSLIVLVSTD